VFADDRLDDIAAEFNRWNRTQIQVNGEIPAAKLYSGAFDADDPNSLIAFLQQDSTLSVEKQAWQNCDSAALNAAGSPSRRCASNSATKPRGGPSQPLYAW